MLNNILQNRLEKLVFPVLPKSKLKNLKEQQKYSYAFVVFGLATLLDLDYKEVFSFITDGGNDKGIDAIYIQNDENIYFFQFKYFDYKTNKDRCICENEVNKVVMAVNDILDDKIVVNSNFILRDKIEEIKDLKQNLIKPLNAKIYFVSNVEDNKKSLHPNCLSELNTRFNDDYRSFEDINLNDLFKLIDTNKKGRKEIVITANGKCNRYDIAGVPSYIINLKARDLVKLYEDGGKDEILTNNIRYYLSSSKINKAIQDTIKDEKYSRYFWLFNNGVSIIADEVEAPEIFNDGNGNQKIKLTNPSIINGGQTTKTLYNLYQETDLFRTMQTNIDGIEILVRIYKTTYKDLIDRIIQGTNSQNAITIKDLKANDEYQKLIQSYFKDNGVMLEIKRGEFNSFTYNPNNFIKNDTLLQAYISLYERKPHIAKNSKAEVFNKNYDIIFKKPDKDLPRKFYRSYEIWMFVNNKERNLDGDFLEKNIFIPNATFQIMYMMSLIDSYIIDVDKNLDNLDDTYNNAVKFLNEIVVRKRKELNDEYSNNSFFKSLESTILIENYFKEHKK